MVAMAYEETTFLCGPQRQRRYGTTTTPTAQKPRYEHVIEHKVAPTDTLQGLALKYNSSMTEVKRLNKLWSNDSMYYKEVLLIPVLSSSLASPSTSHLNGALNSSHEQKASNESNSKEPQNQTESVRDIFSRIDRSIKASAKNVRRLERDSSIKEDRTPDEPTHSGNGIRSWHSQYTMKSSNSPSPPLVETRRIRTSLDKLQQVHDQFYQL